MPRILPNQVVLYSCQNNIILWIHMQGYWCGSQAFLSVYRVCLVIFFSIFHSQNVIFEDKKFLQIIFFFLFIKHKIWILYFQNMFFGLQFQPGP